MITSPDNHSKTPPRAYAEGWAASIFLHLLGMIGAILLAANLKLPPQPTPFTWEIAMIEPSSTEPEIVQQPEPLKQPEPVKQAEPVKQPPSKVTELQPAVRKVQTRNVQPVSKPVQQQVHEIRQAVKPVPRQVDQHHQTVKTAQASHPAQTAKVESIESRTIEAQTYSASSHPIPVQTQPVMTDPTPNVVKQAVSHSQTAAIATKEAVHSTREVASTASVTEQAVIEHTSEDAATPVTNQVKTISASIKEDIQAKTKIDTAAPQVIEQAFVEEHLPATVEQTVAQNHSTSITEKTLETRAASTTAMEASPLTRQVVQVADQITQEISRPVNRNIVTHNLNTPSKIEKRTVTANAQSPQSREDYSWLAELLWNRIEQFKRYPAKARMRHWEGQVVLLAVITNAGEVTSVDVVKSSGYDVLDDNAIEALRLASPLALNQHMKESRVSVQIPINYRLGR